VTGFVGIEEATAVSAQLAAAVRELVAQLSSSAAAPTDEELSEVAAGEATTLLIARDAEGAVIGMLTLALFRIPTGVRAWIEDVVVDERSRGHGAGELLVRRALELARERGARTVDLTSRPSREAANRLYERLGFEPRETDVYRLSRPRRP
jgi:ribosomal protein S18 acetylase RimI-like enzyme